MARVPEPTLLLLIAFHLQCNNIYELLCTNDKNNKYGQAIRKARVPLQKKPIKLKINNAVITFWWGSSRAALIHISLFT